MKSFLDSHGNEYDPPKEAEIKWRVSVYALVKKNDSILCIKEEGLDKWELPGGGVEDLETFAEGLARECYEESGYKVKIASNQPLHVNETRFYRTFSNEYRQGVGLIYSAELVSEEQNLDIVEKNVGETITSIEWVPIKDLNEENLHHDFWSYIKTLK